MEILHAIVLGIVQGLSEFLPISSSGHLELTRWLLGWESLSGELETAFDVAVHLGTLIGAVGYLRRDVARYTVAALGPLRGRALGGDGRVAWFLAASAVPAGVVGMLFRDQIADADQIGVIAVMLIGFGLVLWVADRRPQTRDASRFSLRDAVLMGFGQALALQPGVSRSGVTLSVARFIGYERDAAARLVFLMSLPVIAGAGAVALFDAQVPASFWPPFLAGMAASAVTGWMAVWATLALVRRRGFGALVVYRVALGVVVLLVLATGWR